MKRLKIVADCDARNPREDGDYADVMYCEHRRYTLGDKDADKPVHEAAFITLASESGATYELEDSNNDYPPDLTYDAVLEMLEEHADKASEESEDLHAEGVPSSDEEREQANVDAERAYMAFDEVRLAKWESEWRVNPGIAIIRDLSLYDHSGITIFAGSPTCRWDSGQVGWQYVTDESLETEWNGDRDKALAYMESTLKEYDDYIRGEVYGFIVEVGIKVEKKYPSGHIEHVIEWEHEDSCWGFIGDWRDKDSGIRDHLDADMRTLLDGMSRTYVDEWQYTDDVTEEDRNED